MMDEFFHYPPELFQLLVDAVPKLCKSKKDLLLFFRGAGVSQAGVAPHEDLLRNDKSAFSKYTVARDLLTKVNEVGARGLRVRRELLKRVVEFDDFTVCWENDRAAARGLVAQIRDLINVKDSFTRMRIEKDEERRQRQEQQEASVKAQQELKAKKENVKAELYALFKEVDAHRRGKALEGVLNRLFDLQQILIKEAFSRKGSLGEGIVEQIDGVIEIDSHLYLVEVKWWASPIGPAELAPHLVRVFSRGGQVRGLFISYSDFTDAAIANCRDAIAQGRIVVLSLLEELVGLLERDGDLKSWIRAKFESAVLDKQPFVRPQRAPK